MGGCAGRSKECAHPCTVEASPFGMLNSFAPKHLTMGASLFVSAVAVSGAVLSNQEMYTPFARLIHISSAARCRFGASPPVTQPFLPRVGLDTKDIMPSLKASLRDVGGVAILDLSGPIALGESSALFGKAIRELMNNDRTKIILNLRDVSSVDRAGIGELVRSYILVKTRTGAMKLLNPTQKVYDLLDLTRLLRVIEVFKDEA